MRYSDYPLTIRIRRNAASGSGFIRHTDAEENGHVVINNNDPFTTRRVKLELGLSDSGWVPHDDDL